jgi:MFS family permease
MPRNLKLFIAFRLLFNARYYYPVFAVIQLDYGLTMEQFAVLNAVWAVSIVVLEVPSGALADRFGRKRLVLAASVLMVLEMALLAFVPLGSNLVVFWAWVANRILSGAAEAAASGADEALAYDSIPADRRESLWPRALSRLMRLSSLAFIGVMLVGAAVYDPEVVNRALASLGSGLVVSKEDVLRMPVYLTLVNALLAVAVAALMKEAPLETSCGGESSLWSGVAATGRWIVGTPLVCGLILAALVHDSVLRLFTVTASEYYRLIGIPVVWFGVVGAASAAIGLFVPQVAEALVKRGSMRANYRLVSILSLLGLVGASLAVPLWGVAVVVFFRFAFGLLNYFTSHYLNGAVDSSHRATVLSFRGLALNLGFGALSLLYGGILHALREPPGGGEIALTEADSVYRSSLLWLPWLFLLLFATWRLHQRARFAEVPLASR